MIDKIEAKTAEPSELEIINGGIEIEAIKIDRSAEKVKVRQLPVSLLGEWGRNQGSENEAYLVELLCDKLDRGLDYNLRNARMTEMRVLQLLEQAPFEQIETIEKRLKAIRAEIEALENKPRWSDTLTDESVARIRDLGKLLNKKKFVAQMNRTMTDAKEMMETMTPAPEQSASENSSSPSQPSGTSQSST